MTTVYDITHGSGGLWEVHLWDGGFELNLQSGVDRIWIERISGLHALPDKDDPRSPRVGRIGENSYPSSPDGKTVTYEGELQASTLPLLRRMRTEFVAAFSPDESNDGERTMELFPQADAYHVSPTAFFTAKVLGLEVGPEEQTSNHRYVRRFVLSLRLSDPRIYYEGLGVDVTHATAAVVTNVGDAPVEPYVNVVVASPGTVTISDGTYTLSFLNVPAGTLLVSFGDRTARVGSTPVELDVPNSDWWDSHVRGIPARSTKTITQTGGTSVRVTFTPATWA